MGLLQFLQNVLGCSKEKKPPAAAGKPVPNENSKQEEASPGENTINQTTRFNNDMTTTENNANETRPPAVAELEYLKKLVEYRLNDAAGTILPPMPDVAMWNLPVKNFVVDNNLQGNQVAATLLLIGLAPHISAGLLDTAIQARLKESGDLPEIGGVRGKNSRSFLPTGQTAVYLLAGDNVEKQVEVESLFRSDYLFAKKKILWLEELPQGEPYTSGRIIIPRDYIDTFIHGNPAPPHYSVSFPAKLVETELTWDDLIISDELREQVKELESWIIHNNELMNKWGMRNRLKKGYRALFYGPPGTGKTFTAGLIGKYTNKEVYKIDLSMIVSKYIGETEKNLELLFTRAEDKGWILFFDEADALFGKRTSVRDAHDKYANQEVSYLLQRIEDYNGLIILATNMKNNIDDAFIRRFNSILKFSLPAAGERSLIWQKSLPGDARFFSSPEERVNGTINLPDTVKRYELSGGNIMNVIQYAALKAVERRNEEKNAGKKSLEKNEDKELPVYLSDVLDGVRREMIKEGKPYG